MINTEHSSKAPHTTGIFAALNALLHIKGSGAPSVGVLFSPVAVIATLTLTAALPSSALAYATVEGPPTFSSASGLPDGRVYEQVSPANKNGNEAGAGSSNNQVGIAHYALAAPEGNSMLFEGTGPMGETASALNLYFVATRTVHGWVTRSILPRTQQSAAEALELQVQPVHLDPSPDLSHVMIAARKGSFSAPPNAECGERQLYLSGPDPFTPATWLDRPEIANAGEACGEEGEAGAPVGGTPDFSTVYFTFPGTLLPEDASRVAGWGFYEDAEGMVREAGVLPDGHIDPFGAVPAASGYGRALDGNQVSADGSRAFFVSPDPASGSSEPVELYVREGGAKTVLVSRDTLLPEVGGLPASAPGGVVPMLNPTEQDPIIRETPNASGSDVFASPDGVQAFFQSEDKLTPDAPEGPPANVSPKTYGFDVDAGSLTYLPGVSGHIVATDEDGSSLAFVNTSVSPARLDLWSAGPDGGTVTPIVQLPEEGVSEARMSSDGSVVVFVTSSTLDEGNFNSGGRRQIYRYNAQTNVLGCVSCSPPGHTPASNVVMSPLRASEVGGLPPAGMVDERGVSADGDRIFFDTADPLVPQATNTGASDVYEWENGVVYLISRGKSPENSYFLDNSEDGSDVFFATSEGLVPGDTDGAYDVYDARIPQPGDNPPSAAVPCEGSVCQGPPSVPSPLGAPASATFSGLGNIAPEQTATPPAAKTTTPKTVKCKKGYVKKKNKCVKRPKVKKSTHGKGSK